MLNNEIIKKSNFFKYCEICNILHQKKESYFFLWAKPREFFYIYIYINTYFIKDFVINFKNIIILKSHFERMDDFMPMVAFHISNPLCIYFSL